MPDYRRLQIFALTISILSVVYNGVEGGISIGFGADAKSHSLIFFGIQSGIEVLSSLLVLWRFKNIARPGEERDLILSPKTLKFERQSTLFIGSLLIALALATESSSIVSLVSHQEPNSSNSSLIISASALVFMILIWLPKRYLAKALDSSVMQGEALCSLSCIQLTAVLLLGSLVFKVWKGGWWVDGATSIVLGLLFAWEGVKMIKWARSEQFSGGCCSHCAAPPTTAGAELEDVEKDICICCREKQECRESDDCKCLMTPFTANTLNPNCCVPISSSGAKCCTRQILPKSATPQGGGSTLAQLELHESNGGEGGAAVQAHCCDAC